NDYIASGTFEATEVMVSSEGVGKILSLNITEGSIIKKGEIVGIIDTTQLYLKKLQILASADAVKSRKPDIEKQIAVTEQQIANFEIEKNRIENLMKSNAVPKKQLDDVNAQIALLKKQLVALKSNLDISTRGLNEESNAIAIQIKQIDDQISKCYIKSPINGTVLIKYAEEGEIAMQGKPLFKMADIENMYLRAYIISSQLADIKIGQNVKVVSDYGSNKIKEYSGTVSWISSKAEFTPKTILTKDERANLVYATKIAVKNDGFLKIGMYGKLKK
ncbi:HlyD family efflux transporter periplasmic adaptor subunit, partial [Bacteroidetes/Chlorobi group bacterium ChocPot_Mid]